MTTSCLPRFLNRRQMIAASVAGAFIAPKVVMAETPAKVRVNMYTAHPDDPDQRMVFSPQFLRVQAGTTIEFIPADGSHNTQTTRGMIPDGAEPWRSPFGKPHAVTLTVPGYYGYHCLPHRSMGMVGLIIVEGENRDSNLASAQATNHRGQAARVWEDIWTKVAAE